LVEGGAGDTEAGSDLGDRDVCSFEQCADGLDLFGRELGSAAPLAAAGACGRKASYGSFADQVAFEFSQCGEYVEDKAASWRTCFDLLRQRFEVDFVLIQFRNESYQVGQISSEPVQSPDNERIAFSQTLETAFQLWPICALSAGLFFINLSTCCAFQCVLLQVESLVVGGNASIANAHVSNRD